MTGEGDVPIPFLYGDVSSRNSRTLRSDFMYFTTPSAGTLVRTRYFDDQGDFWGGGRGKRETRGLCFRERCSRLALVTRKLRYRGVDTPERRRDFEGARRDVKTVFRGAMRLHNGVIKVSILANG